MPHITLHTPLGELTVFEDDGAIVALDWGRGAGADDAAPTPLLREAAAQLQDYFDGQRTGFDLPLNPQGSEFRRKVWDALRRIPPGETRSYLDIAREIGCRSPRAIGQANGDNPIPIIIPCHRVVAADGSLGGYSGGEGAATKRYLLALEARARTGAPTGELPLSSPPPGGQHQESSR
ncbi:methylated-DNA--[protein]-cysteine S-methyltransferase [Paracraurococcus lichenis]|uniref:Methylated-DNA--protein-cysteine methyltransferase n=1 Tax=Paracraurococcus lichenis TaxID=3064888 RepID=A0ABT9E7K0_9PROT|nr:methylated-DNA--[protein]-cysteine S-methyltransferase [Paracraurococcus sp. LOR1-02]MDO9712159.1 methylated-DNA--[protein]-cysteine S-methyltransferase [Paracraurococcus sp. LOR1-02]